MSGRHLLAAGELPISRPPVKAVLLALCSHANYYTGVCWPSVERLMLFTALSRRAVQGALRELEHLGLIETELGSNKHPSVYTLTLADCPEIEQNPRRPGKKDSVKGARDAPPEPPKPVPKWDTAQEMHDHSAGGAPHSAGGAPEQSMNNHKNKEDARVCDEGADDAPVVRIDEGWMPGDQAWQWAVEHAPAVDLNHETQLFIARSQAGGVLHVDPEAAWRSWILHAVKFAERDAKREARGSRARPGRGDADGLARLREAATRLGGGPAPALNGTSLGEILPRNVRRPDR